MPIAMPAARPLKPPAKPDARCAAPPNSVYCGFIDPSTFLGAFTVANHGERGEGTRKSGDEKQDGTGTTSGKVIIGSKSEKKIGERPLVEMITAMMSP
eukprot:1333844-Rhodomonas_salina.1